MVQDGLDVHRKIRDFRERIDPTDRDAFEIARQSLEKTLDDVTRQGEIEGLSFDTDRKQLLVCYNRGAIIVKGMPKGFYEGYDAEIHEVFAYDMQ